jgi:hypothetical protein
MRNVIKSVLGAVTLAAGFLLLGASPASAGECNLYTADADCLYTLDGSTAMFQVVDPQPTGTGYIDSFLRVQMKGYEEGYNTDARPALCDSVECDIKTDPNFTRTLELADVPTVTIDGVDYRQFFLDINEPDANPQNYITLDQIEIYLSDTADLSSYSPTAGFGDAAIKIWDLDTLMPPDGSPLTPPGDNWINLDYSLVGGGSGSGDMVMYIPDSYFGDQTYVYLYSQFGCVHKYKNDKGTCGTYGDGTKYSAPYASQAGFEEWWVYNYSNQGPGGGGLSAVPEPATFGLLATGLAYVARRRTRKGKK